MRRHLAALLVVAALVACRGGDEVATVTTVGSTTSTSSTPSTTATLSSTSTSTTSTTVADTLAPTTSTTSTTTTTTTIEPARDRPPDRLPRPNGFARHEPLPAWEGEAPLTGLPLDEGLWARPALAVKIDNSPDARPQWNLTAADLVIEENVEGVTRFVAVYHSTTPDRIGPVRSARMSDLDILAGMNRPVLAWSGGNPGVTSYMGNAHKLGWLANFSAQSTSCYWRSSTRAAPHNLMLDPSCVWESTTYAGPARPLFPRRGADDPAAVGRADTEFRVRMDGVSVGWTWNADVGRYERRQAGDWHTDTSGARVSATNVVELFVEYHPSVVDARSPEAVTVGSGRAVVHVGGVAISGRWVRADRFEPFTLVADDGSPILLEPGVTWVELPRG